MIYVALRALTDFLFGRHLAPGGYYESHEMVVDVHNDMKEVTSDNYVDQWSRYMREGISQMNRSLAPDIDGIANIMREVGFVNVVVNKYKTPLGLWAKEEHLKQAGAVQLVALLEGVDSMSVGLFQKCLGWGEEQVTDFLAKVKRDMRDRRMEGLYWPA